MAKAAFWTTTDAEARKCGEQTGLLPRVEVLEDASVKLRDFLEYYRQ